MHLIDEKVESKKELRVTTLKFNVEIKEHASVTLVVSVGEKSQVREDIFLILKELVDYPYIKKITLLLTGELQFHRLEMENKFNTEIAHDIASKINDVWIKENSYYISVIEDFSNKKNIHFEIKTWGEYKKAEYEKKYEKYLGEVRELYSNKKPKKFYNNTYRLVFKSKRYQKYVDAGFNKKEIESSLLNYVLEECAMEALRIDVGESDYELYVGVVNSSIKNISEYYREKLPENRGNILQILEIHPNADPVSKDHSLYEVCYG
jgi:hypothetical protein